MAKADEGEQGDEAWGMKRKRWGDDGGVGGRVLVRVGVGGGEGSGGSWE